MYANLCSRIHLGPAAKGLVLALAVGALASPLMSRTAVADDFTSGTIVTTSTVPVTLDANGNIVDPGSVTRINHYVRDAFGRLFREYGYRWTSSGIPQNNLSMVRIYEDSPSPVVVVNTYPRYVPIYRTPVYVSSYPRVWVAGRFPWIR